MGIVTAANLTSGEGQDTGTPFTGVTTAVNTVSGRTYFLAIATDDTTSATPVTVDSISTAGGVTWSRVDAAIADASNGRYLELWSGVCSATSSSVQWTITFTGVTANATYAYIIDEATGSALTGTIVQSAKTESDSASPISATLAAFSDGGNATYAACLNDATGGTGTLTAEAGWTTLGSQQNTTSNGITLKTAYLSSNDTSPSFTGSGTSDDYSLIAVEIKRGLEADLSLSAISWFASNYVNNDYVGRAWMMGDYIIEAGTPSSGHAHRKVNQAILHSKLQGRVN